MYLARRNPDVNFADWPRTWRSHAVYVSQFAAVGAAIDKMFYCCRVDDSPPGYSTDYDGVALISAPVPENLRGTSSAEIRALIDTDELRVFSTLVKDFEFDTRESQKQGTTGRAAVIRFLARREGTSREDFDARLAAHFDAVAGGLQAAGATGYVQDAVLGTPPPGYVYDAVTQCWFDTPEAALAAANGGAFAAAEDDLSRFCDMARSVSLMTRVIHEWPRG